MFAQREYMCHHDKVAFHLHWCLWREYKLQVEEKWCCYKPEKVIENDQIKIMWNFNIQTDCILEAIQNLTSPCLKKQKKKRKCLVIDIAGPDDHNIIVQEIVKLKKYTNYGLRLPEYVMFRPLLSQLLLRCWDLYQRHLKTYVKSE